MNAIDSAIRARACALGWLRALLTAALVGASSVASPQAVRVVEYGHDWEYESGVENGLHLQFLTADTNEIRALDAGTIVGWHRTRFEFMAYDTPGADRVPVCRFFGPGWGGVPRHFYTAFAEECEALKSSRDWIYEGHVFYVRMPAASGACGAGDVPMYRRYRMRQRYVPGGPGGMYVPEGPQHHLAPTLYGYSHWSAEGPGGIAFCVPASFDVARSRLDSLATGPWEFTIGAGASLPPSLRYLIPDAPLRVTFGPVAEVPRVANFDTGELLAEYAAPMTGDWGGLSVVGQARWRPLEDKVVVQVSGDWLFPGAFGAIAVLTFDYTGGAPIRGGALTYVYCGAYGACLDLTRPLVLVGERR